MDDVEELLACFLDYRSVLAACCGLRGRLVLLTGGVARRAAAARIAGAAVLYVEPQEQAAKAMVRAGYCDFAVANLDEALRILKNEVRRGAAVGVCLLGDCATVTAECLKRGIQPDLLEREEPALERRGARVVSWQAALGDAELAVAWRLNAGPLRAMAQVDALVPGAADRRGEERARWLLQAPLVLGRAAQRLRLAPMHAGELARLLEALRALPATPSMAVTCNGATLWPEG